MTNRFESAMSPVQPPPQPTLPPSTGLAPETSTLRRVALPVLALAVAVGFVVVAALRWDIWIGNRAVQSTDDAYIRAQTTRLSSRVAGEVKTVAVNDFQRVKMGDLLLQIDRADYEAQLAQADAGVAGAQAALDNLANQIELQYATIAQAEAQRAAAEAQDVQAGQELERQKSLSQSEAGTRQRFEQAIAAQAKTQADVRASRALIAAQKHQLEVLSGTRKQRAADLLGSKATRDAATLKLGYTTIVAPFDGVVSERQVQAGDYLNVGTNLISVVPLPDVYVVANFKETQLTRVKPGQPVEIVVDTFSNQTLRGRVERIAPASGSQFALLPPDNASGNFTKVVQRVPVRIQFDKNQPLLDRLLPGMSVTARIDTEAAAR
jgi:membrane fusion protein (multidrug efflux system)